MPIKFEINEQEKDIVKVSYHRKKTHAVQRKRISLDQFVQLFGQGNLLSTPVLPVGTRRYATNGSNIYLWIEIPKHKRIFKFSNGKEIEMLLPISNVFVIIDNKNIVRNIDMFCIKQQNNKIDNMLYYYIAT